jgi:type I restriction enzyme M protein
MLIMRKLRRQPKPGRAGVVVPNGTLFASGVAARIKEDLLKEFNLHTIVRLPNGVFAPYTSIPTNLFDRAGPTREVWYYERRPPGQEPHQDPADPVRRSSPTARRGGTRRGESARLEGAGRRHSGERLQPRHQEPERQTWSNMPPEQLADSILLKEQRTPS